MKRPVIIFWLAMIMLAAGLPRSASSFAAAAELPDRENPIRVETTADSVLLAVTVPEFTRENVLLDGKTYTRLQLPGASGAVARPGTPDLPRMSLLVAAPNGAEAAIENLVFATRTETQPQPIAPAPSPQTLENDLVPGEFDLVVDPAAYTEAAALAPAPVHIAEDAWVRGQRIFRVEISPFTYDPAAGVLTVRTEFEFRIRFTGGEISMDCENCLYETGLEKALESQLVNYDQGLAWRVAPGSDALREQIQVPQNNPFLGPRYTIVVDTDGIYHLTYADLQAAGMDVDSVNPQSFRMVNHGQDISIFVFGEGDGSFDPGDYVVFFGERFHGDIMAARYEDSMTRPTYDPEDQGLAANNWFWMCEASCELDSYFERYTVENVYYLLEGGSPGPRMGSINGAPGGATLAQVYYETVRREDTIHWFSHEWYDDDIWFMDRLQLPTAFDPRNYAVDLSAVATGAYSATVHAEISSRNQNLFASPDHHTQMSLNGFMFDNSTWDGRIRYVVDTQIPQGELQEGSNTFTFQLVNDSAVAFPDMYFDFFEITYAREFIATDNALDFNFTEGGTWRYPVSGLSSGSVEVYRVTDPMHPVRVTNPTVSGGGPFTATFQGGPGRYLTAGTGSGILTPVSIDFYNPPVFENMAEAEWVIITHANFLPASQTLAAHRSSQGYSVAVIDVADLYHEFNDGIYHPIAIKNFLAWTFENWETPVVYAALVGSGNWNMQNFGDGTKPYHNAPETYMPPNLAYVDPWQGEVDSANLLATIIGSDAIPDVYLGRFPVSTNAQMAVMVNKIISYENAPMQDWQRNVLFIADNVPDSAGNFIALSENIIADFIDPNPAYNALRIYQDDGDGIPNGFDYGCVTANSPNCNNLTQAIINTLNITGTLMVNYIGHAALPRWSGELIFENSDVAALTNSDRLPVVLSMTCLDGHWLYPNQDSLVYTLLATTPNGAVGTFSATGLGVATGHDPLQRGFYSSLMEDGTWLMGPAETSGKIELWGVGFYRDLLQTFMVFGDPALGIRSAYNVTLTPPSDSKSGAPGAAVIYTLTIKNTGSAADTFDVLLSGDWFAVPSAAVVGPLNANQSAQVQITVEIPPDALGNESDITTVTVRSRGDVLRSDSTQLTTTAQNAGLSLNPSNLSGFAKPGEVVTYTVSLTNLTAQPDTFNLSASGNSWSVGMPAQVGPVGSGGSVQIEITVSIPQSADPGDVDTVTITATSQNEPGNQASVSITTTAVSSAIYLPIVVRE